jgi:hypothetical protein
MIRFYRNGCMLYIFGLAHDPIRKPLTLFGIMRCSPIAGNVRQANGLANVMPNVD